MATTKKKSTLAKATVARKTTASKKIKVATPQSFRRYDDTTPFMTFKFTQQSIYWLILSAFVLALGAWVMYLNVQIQGLYDQVEINSSLREQNIAPVADKIQVAPSQSE
jgi:hypothetical protein